MKKILVISPHPDDEIIGCGGILDKFKRKHQISWTIITKMQKGYKPNQIEKRKKEIQKVKIKLNIKNFFNLNFNPKELNRGNLEKLIEELSIIIKKVKPQIILAPYLHDAHSDHFYTSYAINHILKVFRYPFIESCYYYETLSETNLSFSKAKKFNPNLYIDITKNIKNKIKLLKIYKSEIKKHPFPRSVTSLKSLALLRGSESGYKFAEAFQIIYKRSKNEI